MLRATFERELQRLQDRLLALGNEVGDNVVEAVEVLRRRDMIGAQRLIAADLWVNERRIGIMTDALLLIATQQPMAGDMRLIASIIEITGELERINDYAKGIAKINLMIGEASVGELLVEMPEMAEKMRAMLYQALEAFSRRDAALARAIPAADDEVDALFNQTYRELVIAVMDDPSLIEHVNRLEWAAHNLERAADRVTNICEWIVYAAVGEYVEMDSEIEAPPQYRRD
ncbi:MAG: phosphate signaling complex protein PhoU [Chloroflexi bacterium]|nr:phosphate signaling complex protein PhoU [Chloroflexota bacterium]MCI0576540.1 phosphate signaling complex protein PhoU [Chloroflexota bacterium]MCI0648808.1 phosphate signaling complex protein PhoU [Chloroflexota bacterium]MCI0726310.1 phosphate signaling complex protein PhoU [Chloroflexota bacterium]